MKLSETVYFNDRKYKTIHDEGTSDSALQRKIEDKRKKKLASKAKLSISIIVLVYTAGLSFPTALHAVRTHSVRRQKVKVLETLWTERNHDPLPPPKLRIKLLGIAWMVAKEILTLGMDSMDLTGQVVDAYLDTPGANVDIDDLKTGQHLHSKGKKESDDKVGKNQSAGHAGNHTEGKVDRTEHACDIVVVKPSVGNAAKK